MAIERQELQTDFDCGEDLVSASLQAGADPPDFVTGAEDLAFIGFKIYLLPLATLLSLKSGSSEMRFPVFCQTSNSNS